MTMSKQTVRQDIAFIERSHGVLHEMITYCLTAAGKRKRAVYLKTLISDLNACLGVHIEFENYVMTINNYPLASSHIKEHQRFSIQFSALLEQACLAESPEQAGKSLKKMHDQHVHYFDDVLQHYLCDKYSLETVTDGLGI